MKVGKRAESFYIPGYLLESFIKHWQFGIKKNLKSGKLGPFFFP
jgi:hypothetical protein